MATSNTVKFTKAEIEDLNKIRQIYADTTAELGQLQTNLFRIEQQSEALHIRQEELRQKFKDTQQRESTFVTSITEKYGEGSYDPDSGLYHKKSTSTEVTENTTNLSK